MAMVTTTHGEMDELDLTKTEGAIDNENEITRWVEYRLGEELVHRSVHVHLKKNVCGDGMAAMLT